jgi:hypothetical protein
MSADNPGGWWRRPGALPVAVERGVGVQAIKVFGKAYLLRSLSPTECLRYVPGPAMEY